ncbi:hypothetical protein D8X75_18265 [Vibrio cholerae]|nr:hypothetical protein [Vibrio cholerae]EGR1403003.1 hypothetical protein [Vibrio cholerae]EGR1429573.1 hypothetical protein [Vibrio cholerae]
MLDNSFHVFLEAYNARLRGWQRINTKLKHNNRNHRGSMGLETPRVDSPFEAFVMLKLQHFTFEPTQE